MNRGIAYKEADLVKFSDSGNPAVLNHKTPSDKASSSTFNSLNNFLSGIGLGSKNSSSPLGVTQGAVFGGFGLPIPGLSSSSSADSGIYAGPSVSASSGSKKIGGKGIDIVNALGIVAAVGLMVFAIRKAS